MNPQRSPASSDILAQVCKHFEEAWQAGQRPRIEDYLPQVSPEQQAQLIGSLVRLEILCRGRLGEAVALDEFLARFPAQAVLLQAFIAADTVLSDRSAGVSPSVPAAPPPSAEPTLPERLGRYRITGRLGRGGFGVVYRGQDDELRRDVAIKVPHRERVARSEDVEAYLDEARLLAGLDHAHIVPVYDVGRTDDGLCFVVSRYIEGSDLSRRLKQGRLAAAEAVELIAVIAEALHHAHRKGLVHRDVKPANILLDRAGKPYLADFGLALREEDYGHGAGFAGTPAYMSPEQARGEGHRVDGRSDVFSLGVVFYELLTGRRPFQGESQGELLDRVASAEARPPRQIDDSVPKELERICLKALAKRASERYTTALDMAEDLRHWLSEGSRLAPRGDLGTPGDSSRLTPRDNVPSRSEGTTTADAARSPRIVPKGLRSFDASDADFFLELLPGPRDRDGLPDSLRFWKGRVEEIDADRTFSVGLMYGPSGCGKSSLVKAGLLPRLAGHVLAVYVEATPEETDARLLRGLRKRCPDLPTNLDLVQTLAALRRGRGLNAGQKVLLVLDQFEQWLHAHREDEDTELVRALRQCDGVRVQAVVLVRDDFWMAATRFLRDLEVRLIEGQNSAAVDLFDLRHARKVLAAFGQAFGALPDAPTGDNDAFLEQAVTGLAEDGKVISVRLALFAEMVKGKPWTPATLRALGGVGGVGVVFLEETFSAKTAPPEHRLHQRAARTVLKALLPEQGTDIKGHMRSQKELLTASGYDGRPREFDDLVRILDGELRLITPTDPEGSADPSVFAVSRSQGTSERETINTDSEPSRSTVSRSQGASERETISTERYYQLTHDYLVPSLRDWLTRKQKETRRGRAELLLADRAAVWNARPENRQLPSLWQWLSIRWLTAKQQWTVPQQKMMARATRYHVGRALLLVLLASLLGWGGYEVHGRLQAHALRARLLDANTADVPTIVKDMAPYRRWLTPLLRDAAAQAEASKDARKQLHASLALLPGDAKQVESLHARLLDAEPHEVPVLRDALAPYQDALRDQLWAAISEPGKERQRLRAAAALAQYDAEAPQWAQVSVTVAHQLVAENPVYLGTWMEAFRPIREKLLAPLAGIYRDATGRESERALATNILADYAADRPQLLAELLMAADDKQFAMVYPVATRNPAGTANDPLVATLAAAVDKRLPPEAKDDAKEQLAKQQANAAVALLRIGRPDKVWPLLKHSPDPRGRSYLIHRLSPLGAESVAIIKRLKEEPDPTIRRALLLCLGEFGEKELPPETRQALLPRLQALYRTDPDPGLHAAAECLLRTWKHGAWLKEVNDEWASAKDERDKRVQGIQQVLAKENAASPPQWYVNSQGHTMVVIPGPVEYLMGSPPTEANRNNDEIQHTKRIGRTFAIAATAVTKEQFLRFNPQFGHGQMHRYPAPTCPIGGVTWYEAAAYCNWLSMQEGIDRDQWCYVTGPTGQVTKLRENYLSLTGYRLPTEAEMEYATRAGALTSRYFGETEDLLPRYAWYFKNSQERTWPVGSLKPNDLGLFDVQGNVYTWCQESYKTYPQKEAVDDDKEDELVISSTRSRVLRGGSFTNQASVVRSATRFNDVPANRTSFLGCRPARTLSP